MKTLLSAIALLVLSSSTFANDVIRLKLNTNESSYSTFEGLDSRLNPIWKQNKLTDDERSRKACGKEIVVSDIQYDTSGNISQIRVSTVDNEPDNKYDMTGFSLRYQSPGKGSKADTYSGGSITDWESTQSPNHISRKEQVYIYDSQKKADEDKNRDKYIAITGNGVGIKIEPTVQNATKVTLVGYKFIKSIKSKQLSQIFKNPFALKTLLTADSEQGNKSNCVYQ
jgi:hypothetical protein